MEILPGIHRIESDLGERFMCQYLLRGEDRVVLIDTGLAGTPEEVIVPYLEDAGLTVDDLDEVIISHADVDHCGGNRALKEMNPRLQFFCGEPDRYLIEDNKTMLEELYSWSEPYGFGPDEETKTWILNELGGNVPIDVGLYGGETLRLGPGRRVEILHLPGHTAGTSRILGREERGGHHHRRRAGEWHLRPGGKSPHTTALLRRRLDRGYDP